MVRLDVIEAHRRECRVNGLVPDLASLFQAIERLYKLTDMIWTSHFKSLWLHLVDLFLQSAIEIGMRNVHRANSRSSKAAKARTMRMVE